jgi:UDP-N-acetylmuramate dehydrogenase
MKVLDKLNLENYNSYRLKAYCAKAYFPQSENDIIELYGKQPHVSLIILGNGNNVILTKEWYDEHFIIFNGNFDHIEVNGSEISAQAGATMLQMSEKALLNSLSGFEVFYDIPSSVGGAVVMNAGASGEEIKDLLVKVRYFDLADLKIKEIIGNKLGFEYRNSFFQKHPDKVIFKAWFRLLQGDPLAIQAKMKETKQKRWAKQPREYPNCGSVFKRPKGHFVGPMLDELGLKGFTIGGAKISEKHSGFIINSGNATGKEILTLIGVIKEKVKRKFGIELELEQKII